MIIQWVKGLCCVGAWLPAQGCLASIAEVKIDSMLSPCW